MTEVQILLDIQRTLGSLESSQKSVGDKLDDIHDQVRYTNGRVNKLRSDVDKLLEGENLKKKDTSFQLTWTQWGVVFASIATVSAYIIEKL